MGNIGELRQFNGYPYIKPICKKSLTTLISS